VIISEAEHALRAMERDEHLAAVRSEWDQLVRGLRTLGWEVEIGSEDRGPRCLRLALPDGAYVLVTEHDASFPARVPSDVSWRWNACWYNAEGDWIGAFGGGRPRQHRNASCCARCTASCDVSAECNGENPSPRGCAGLPDVCAGVRRPLAPGAGRAPETNGCREVCLVVAATRSSCRSCARIRKEALNPYILSAAMSVVPFAGWAAHVRVLRNCLATARTCPVTGVLTRDGWTRAADTRRTNLVLFLDLDGFKAVNDTFGHEAGDAVLKATAERLTTWAGSAGVVGRLGGDEFVVATFTYLPLRSLADALAESIPWNGHVLRVGSSLGAAHKEPDQPLSQVLGAADHAMYRAKQSPGTAWVWGHPDEPMGSRVRSERGPRSRTANGAVEHPLTTTDP
jgi:diguanylate cyclase (GGDEF)-like protein